MSVKFDIKGDHSLFTLEIRSEDISVTVEVTEENLWFLMISIAYAIGPELIDDDP